MPLSEMLRHNLVHTRDMMIGQFVMFAVFGGLFFGLLLWLKSRNSYRFRIRPHVGQPKQIGREMFNSARALVIYNGIQIGMRAVILAFGLVLTFDKPLPLWETLISFPLIMIGH